MCLLYRLPIVSHDERLTMFNLDRLELHRLRRDVVDMFEIVRSYTVFLTFHVIMLIILQKVTVLNLA